MSTAATDFDDHDELTPIEAAVVAAIEEAIAGNRAVEQRLREQLAEITRIDGVTA